MRGRALLPLTVVLLLLLAGRAPVQAQIKALIVGPNENKFPIAISPLKNLSPGDAGAATRFADIVARDLTLSGMFRVIPRESYIEPADSSGTTEDTINFANWSVIGAPALVKGTILQEGDQVVLEARLFDVYQRLQLAGRRYKGESADVRRMAHKFADEIMAKLTGARGPFDSRIAFLSRRDGRFKDLYVMSLDGGDVRRLTSLNTINLSPSWAPDKSTLLLTSYRTGKPELFTVNADGSGMAPLAASRGEATGGRWSPDRSRLAIVRESGGNTDLYIVGTDGSVRQRLTDHWAIDVSPSWSPDAGQIAFCSDRSGSPQIYTIDVDGGRLRRVTFEGNYNTSPAWSPKGDKIAYSSRVGGSFQIFTVNVDGTDPRPVTSSAGDSEDPSWSPDGRYLVFSSTRSGVPRLYVADASGASQVELTSGQGGDTSPAWSGWLD